jgi:putative DNA methylase
MSWDFTEANPFGKSSGGMANCAAAIANYLEVAQPNAPGVGAQCDAQRGLSVPGRLFISTDPPYYDNIGYADLSDFFYVWLRPTLGEILPELFSTLATPKDEELVADPIRRGGEAPAEAFFIDGMTSAMKSIAGRSQEGYPITIYYAFKQSETSDQGTASTGWETFLTAVLKSGLSITGTWPIRTEGANRMVASGTNALSSSIVLVCRNNLTDLPVATKGEFLRLLKLEMPKALAAMQHACLAPVDVAQAAIGPGMAIFCRFSKVLDAAGVPMTVRDVLVEINQVLDESLAEQESEFDSDTKWAVTWFERNCFTASDFGTADMLARAKNTSVAGLIQAGIVNASAGKVKLLAPSELPADWDPATDQRLTVWEIAHHIIRSTSLGEEQAAAILAKVSTKSDSVIELTYRLFRICESKKEYDLASNYNNLIQIWPELIKISSSPRAGSVRTGEFELDA